MRAHRLASRIATALRGSGAAGGEAAARASLRCVSAAAARDGDAEDSAVDVTYGGLADAPALHNAGEAEEGGEAAEEPQRAALAARLLPYVYAPLSDPAAPQLALPTDGPQIRRMQRIMKVEDKSALLAALAAAEPLETEEAGAAFINLTASYIRQQARLAEMAESPSYAARQRAAHVLEELRQVRLTAQERNTLLRKSVHLVETRRVSLVVASRLVRLRWPESIASLGGGLKQAYVMDLIRGWATEELQKKSLTPREARALLANCAFALKAVVRRHRREPAGGGASAVSSFIGALATTACDDLRSPGQAEGLISLMWSVHATGCPAPASFWDAAVQRVLSMNDALDTALDESAARMESGSSAAGDTTASPPSAGAAPAAATKPRKHNAAGHFFTTLTTRQLYRFLLLLKRVRWDGDATVLHQLADRTLRNVAFELEAADFGTPAKAGEETTRSGGAEAGRAAAATAAFAPFSATNDAAARSELSLMPAAERPRLSKAAAERRLRKVADMRPSEFLELLHLAGDLGVPFSVSATRMADELLTPLVAHLDGKELLLLLRVTGYTRSQSPTLLQAVLDRLVGRGVNAPYAVPLAKTAVKVASKMPLLLRYLRTDDFVEHLACACEAQHTLVRAAEVASMGHALYTLSRLYEETSPGGARIRGVVNLLCAQMDRLVQLQVAPLQGVERLLEETVLLRMRGDAERYAAVHELLASRAVAVEQLEQLKATREQRLTVHAAQMPASETAEDEGEGGLDPQSPRWETLSEADLPTVPRAAVGVYTEFVYMMERLLVVRSEMNGVDFFQFRQRMRKVGLYSLLHGAQLFQRAHIDAAVAYTSDAGRVAGQLLPHSMPRAVEKMVTEVVLEKLAESPVSAAMSDSDVLRALGHVHCDAAKVDAVIALLATSPLQKLKRQRPVWLYVNELARRFGSAATQQAMDAYLKKALY